MQKKKGVSLRISREKVTWEGLDVPFQVGPEWLASWKERDPGLEFDLKEPLSGEIHLEKHGGAVLIRGRLAGELMLACGRCLATFGWPLSAEFDLLLEQGTPTASGEEVELSAADLDVDYLTGEEIDLEAVIKEQVLLALPLQAVCREECAGLCPACGANLNEEHCTCAGVDSQSPFAVLKRLQEKS